MNIAFRVDGNGEIGIGHVMRCLTLAQELSAKEGNIYFILGANSKDMTTIIESALPLSNPKIFILPEMEDDTKATKEILKDIKPDWLVIDHYGIDQTWEKEVAPLVKYIMAIDDLANRKHECNILLDQNLIKDYKSRYLSLIPEDCTALLGPSYALLRSEFAKKTTKPHTDEVRNILVSFGGADTEDFTGKTLDVLANYPDIAINVVVGGSNIHKDKIEQRCQAQPHMNYHCQINYMSSLMHEADLFIGAGGTTSWERMALGLPGVIIAIADNQVPICEALADEDLIKHVGNSKEYSQEEFRQKLDEALEDQNWRQQATEKGMELVDGRGTKKVVAQMLAQDIRTEKAQEADSQNIYEWRTAEINRSFSNNQETFNFQSHQEWYKKITESKGSDLLVGQTDSPLGVVRFDYTEERALISIYLVPGWHGKGWGLDLLMASINWLLKNKVEIKKIEAEILNHNYASNQIFADAGFSVIDLGQEKSLWGMELKRL